MNKASQRVKRPVPAQTGPVRNPAAAPPRPGQAAAAPGDLFSAAGAAVCGVLENGVRTAYAVIDEYMRRGREAAGTIFNDPNRRGFMNDDRGSSASGYNAGGYYGPGNFAGGNYGAPNPMGALAQQWLAMAMQAWGMAMSSLNPAQWPQGMNPNAWAGQQQPASIAVSISATRPVEVTANLYTADPAGLLCDALRADGGTAGTIEPPSIVRDGGSLRLSAKLGAKQQAGTYRAFIRKKSDGTVAGDITMVVS